jgi:hypothetical protein
MDENYRHTKLYSVFIFGNQDSGGRVGLRELEPSRNPYVSCLKETNYVVRNIVRRWYPM